MRPLFRLLPLLLIFLVSACSSGQRRAAGSTNQNELGKINVYYEYTASDAANRPAAFNVKRSESPKGPFNQVNSSPISAKAGAGVGDRQLLLSDEGLPMGRDYYYYIEKVDARGNASKATSVARATVMLPLLTVAKPTAVPPKEGRDR